MLEATLQISEICNDFQVFFSEKFHMILLFWTFKIVANLDFLVFLYELAYSGTFDTIF